MVFRLGIFVVLIAALAAVVVFGYSILDQGHRAQRATVAPPPTEQILVAAAPLSGGALIQPNNISTSTVLVAKVPADAIQDTPQNRTSITGAMVKSSLAQGAVITNASIIRPGDHGFLAAVLSPGMRAVTVAVDNVTGADGLIWPGDRVDVLLTQNISGAPESKSIAAEVVLSNVRVIATGTELIKSPGNNGNNNNQSASTVTLEVTQEQAARCLVAVNLGKLSLIVHSAQSLQAKVSTAPPPPVWAGQVSPALSATQPTEQPVTTVKVISAGTSGEFKF